MYDNSSEGELSFQNESSGNSSSNNTNTTKSDTPIVAANDGMLIVCKGDINDPGSNSISPL